MAYWEFAVLPDSGGRAMRVLLIKPSVRGFCVEIGRHVPIGPAYLAACLRDHGHDVTLFDALSFTEIHGLVFRCDPRFCRCDHGGGLHVTPAAAQVPDLDALPLPATDLLDFDRYGRWTTLITSRGCPFSCTFCTVHATVGKAFRYRSPQNVVDELRHYVFEHGVRQFRIEDDNFTFDVDRVRELCGAIRASGLDVELHLANGITVVKLSHELVRDMVGAGFRSLFFGLETTEPAQLRKLRKGFTSVDQVRAGADWFLEEGAEVGASLIVGLLGQDLDQAAQDAT